MQAAESKQAAAVESLKEGWVAELKRQKEAWAAAEKARRDTWLADKTKQVKELTVKVRHTPAKSLLHVCCPKALLLFLVTVGCSRPQLSCASDLHLHPCCEPQQHRCWCTYHATTHTSLLFVTRDTCTCQVHNCFSSGPTWP